MFEQHSIFQKVLRVLIFIILTVLTLLYIPNNVPSTVDLYKITSAITIIFIVYDHYYPAVRIELEKNQI